MNTLPHKSQFSDAEFPPSVILQRYKVQAFANEILGNIYHQNSIHHIFEMCNAATSDELLSKAIACWKVCFEICDHYPLDRELELCHLRIIPNYLSICNQLNRITPQETITEIMSMSKIAKTLYDDLSVERAEIFHAVTDLMVMYCPNNDKLLELLSTDILYNCSRPINPDRKTERAQRLRIEARTKLLEIWEKQSWNATLKLCQRIAYRNLSPIMIKDVEYLCHLKFHELPVKERSKNLRYFQRKLKGKEIPYGNAIITAKLIKSNLFVLAAKKLRDLSDMELEDHLPIHVRCLEKFFMETQEANNVQ